VWCVCVCEDVSLCAAIEWLSITQYCHSLSSTPPPPKLLNTTIWVALNQLIGGDEQQSANALRVFERIVTLFPTLLTSCDTGESYVFFVFRWVAGRIRERALVHRAHLDFAACLVRHLHNQWTGDILSNAEMLESIVVGMADKHQRFLAGSTSDLEVLVGFAELLSAVCVAASIKLLAAMVHG
jgi:hypothetical protein